MFMGKSFWLSEAWFSCRLYWNQRILSESNELMNLKVHICNECFIYSYSIMPETNHGCLAVELVTWCYCHVRQYLVSTKMQEARFLLSAPP